MEDKVIQILIQGGLTSVALLSLWVNYRIVSNHIQHATDANTNLEVAIQKLVEFLNVKLK